MQVAGATDTGLQRSENQDAYSITHPDAQTVLAVVCDGMGGAAGGRKAGRLACDTFCTRFTEYYKERAASEGGITDFAVKRCCYEAVYAANLAVRTYADKHPAMQGMGSTLVAACAHGDRVYLVHVGDSRAYLYRAGQLQQLTRDHSYVQQLLEAGILTPEEAILHPQKNYITRAIGPEDEVMPEFTALTVEEGDQILLCTDGLSGALRHTELALVLARQELPQHKAERLIALANARGGADNITACLLYLDEAPLTTGGKA